MLQRGIITNLKSCLHQPINRYNLINIHLLECSLNINEIYLMTIHFLKLTNLQHFEVVDVFMLQLCVELHLFNLKKAY